MISCSFITFAVFSLILILIIIVFAHIFSFTKRKYREKYVNFSEPHRISLPHKKRSLCLFEAFAPSHNCRFLFQDCRGSKEIPIPVRSSRHSIRYSLGVIPSVFLKIRLKYWALSYPDSMAIVKIVLLVSHKSCFAFSIRSLVIY